MTRTLSILLLIVASVSFSSASDAQTRTVTIFFTGFVQGNFGPCGCKLSPSGGLARRAGYVSDYSHKKDGYVIQIDLGNYFMPLGPHSTPVNALMLNSLESLPLSVLNLAPDDLFLWQKLSRETGRTQVISTNLTPRSPSQPVPRRYAMVEIPASDLHLQDNLRIGFLGISDPRRVRPNSGFAGFDPVEAISRVKGEVMRQADFLVVLADYHRKPGPIEKDSLFYRLAMAHPEVYAILSTEKRFLLHRPEQVNNAVILSSVERGRYLGQLEITLDAKGKVAGFEPEFIELQEGVPEDQEFLRRQERLQASLP
ncbi:MAG: hypothetical protein ACE5JX_10500 [Acidobacteriota bacterium]